MKNETNKPAHITKGDVLDDLGLSRSEASALKVKANLLDAILREIQSRKYTQKQLIQILDEYQPAVSNLVRGKIGKLSLEKLLAYSDRLNMKANITIQTTSGRHRDSRGYSGLRTRSRKWPHSNSPAVQKRATHAIRG